VKLHRTSRNGKPLCGRPHGDVTPLNDDVTCGLCHRSMWGSWGVEPPAWVSRNKGGRKRGNPKPMRLNRGDRVRHKDGWIGVVTGFGQNTVHIQRGNGACYVRKPRLLEKLIPVKE
jgi:hypothetical protein